MFKSEYTINLYSLKKRLVNLVAIDRNAQERKSLWQLQYHSRALACDTLANII